ncbi:MAG: response regulator [Promethearchaeia archaeon]
MGKENFIKNEKKYIGILVSENTRKKWKSFAIKNNFNTTSNFIRNAVTFFIENFDKIKLVEDFPNIAHNFKNLLTSIKGYAQLIIKEYKNDLKWEILSKIKEIIDNSEKLEDYVNDLFENIHKHYEYDILIVDDDESTINLLTDFFEKRDLKCKATINGKETLEFLKNHRPKIILLDILLPDMSGYEICNYIKSNEELKDIPVFYITAVTKFEVENRLKETKANGFFLKPFNFEEFEILNIYYK